MERRFIDRENESEVNCCRSDPVIRKNCHCYKFYLDASHNFNQIPKYLITFLLRLEKYAPVVSIICTYLPHHHLQLLQIECNVSEVWMEFASNELARRFELNWQTVDYLVCPLCNQKRCGSKVYEPVKSSQNLYRSNISTIFSFYDTKTISLTQKVQVYTPPESMKVKKNFSEYLDSEVLLHSNALGISIGMRNIQFFEPSCKESNSSPYTSIYFPHIPNIKIQHFIMGTRFEFPARILGEGEKIECLVIFTRNDLPGGSLCNALGRILRTQTVHIPIAGACAWDLSMRQGEHHVKTLQKRDLFCIMFKSTATLPHVFYAGSMLISRFENFQDKVDEFRKHIRRDENEILMVFTCFARNRRQIEMVYLREMFQCPMVIMDVNGEIGHNCYSDEHKNCHCEDSDIPRPKRIRRTKRGPDYFHTHTTVLLFISWNKPN